MRRPFAPAARIFGCVLLLLGMLPSAALAVEESCRTAMRERFNLAIGLYRIELGASHMVGQLAAARNNPGRQQQLATAEDGLRELLTRLKSRANDILPDTSAKGRCTNDTAQVAPIHAALVGYFNAVQARWQFMERRIAELRRLPPGQHPSLDTAEIELWIQEPLARYEVWRTLAQIAEPKSEPAAALYVMGMMTRFEFDAATALREAVKPNGDPRPGLTAASDGAAALKRNWPRPKESDHARFWNALATAVAAMPEVDPTTLPDAAPAGGWPAWIGGWLRPYAEAYSRSASTVLKGLEDLGL